MEALGELYVVISINAEDILNHVAFALYIGAITWHFNLPYAQAVFFARLRNTHLEGTEDGLDGVSTQLLTDERVAMLLSEGHAERIKGSRLDVEYRAGNLTACHFLNNEGATLEHIKGIAWVATAFVAERCIGGELMTASCLADAHGIKICAFEEYVLGVFRNATLQTAKYTGNTHRLLCVANHQVLLVHFAFDTIEGYEFLPLLSSFNDDFLPFDLVIIKRMERLSHLMEHEIGGIHHVVDGAESNGAKCVLQPFG